MLILFNPTAGSRRRRRLDLALDALARRGCRPRLLETQAAGDARRLAREAARQGETLVVAAGGDGTIAEVAQGIAGSAAWLGILPFGTANVLAHELGIPTRPEAAAAVLAGGRLRWLRPGIAEGADGGARLFVQMLGAGFDAAVVGALDLRLKRRLGRAAYVLQALREMPRYPFPCFRVTLDGETLPCASVIISKGRLYAGRHLLAPRARPDAAGFEVALFRRGGIGQALLAGAALPLNLLPWLPGMVLRHASRIALETDGVPLQTDGDPLAQGAMRVREAPAPLPVLVP